MGNEYLDAYEQALGNEAAGDNQIQQNFPEPSLASGQKAQKKDGKEEEGPCGIYRHGGKIKIAFNQAAAVIETQFLTPKMEKYLQDSQGQA
jgi:hypothetical protein